MALPGTSPVHTLCVYGSPLNPYAGAALNFEGSSIPEQGVGSLQLPVSANEQLSGVAAEQMLPLLARQGLHQGIRVHLRAKRERA